MNSILLNNRIVFFAIVCCFYFFLISPTYGFGNAAANRGNLSFYQGPIHWTLGGGVMVWSSFHNSLKGGYVPARGGTSFRIVPINGTCGTANGRTFSLTDTGYFPYTQCATGIVSNRSFPAPGTTATWNCIGFSGGTNTAGCTASRTATVAPTTCTAPTSCGTFPNCSAPSGCDNQCGSTKVSDCAGTCGGSAIDYDGPTPGCGVPPITPTTPTNPTTPTVPTSPTATQPNIVAKPRVVAPGGEVALILDISGYTSGCSVTANGVSIAQGVSANTTIHQYPTVRTTYILTCGTLNDWIQVEVQGYGTET